jgi:hypothetical protein
MALSGILRSSHALIFVLSGGTLVLFRLAAEEYEVVAYIACGLFSLCVVAVIGRYVFKGPEQDRAQPILTYSPQQLQIVNVEPAAMENLAKLMVTSRHPLPAPVGILTGPASDPSAVQILSPEDAKQLEQLVADVSPLEGTQPDSDELHDEGTG